MFEVRPYIHISKEKKDLKIIFKNLYLLMNLKKHWLIDNKGLPVSVLEKKNF